MQGIFTGLEVLEAPALSQCAQSVDHLMSYVVTHREAARSEVSKVKRRLGWKHKTRASGKKKPQSKSWHTSQPFAHGALFFFVGVTHRIVSAPLCPNATRRSSQEERSTVLQLQQHLATNARLVPDLITKFFEQLLFGPFAQHWAVTRPLLSLILADSAAFEAYRASLVASQVRWRWGGENCAQNCAYAQASSASTQNHSSRSLRKE